MPERILALLETGKTFSSNYADYLRLVAASMATFNALHGSGFTRWVGRAILRLCAPCRAIYRWGQER